MRHGSTMFLMLILLGLGIGGFTGKAVGGELADDRLGMRTVPILLLTRQTSRKLSISKPARSRNAGGRQSLSMTGPPW